MCFILVLKRTVTTQQTGTFLQIYLAQKLAKVVYLGLAGMVIHFTVREGKRQ